MAPLLCIPKKDGTLRMALDACQCNDNTIKDVTPLLNQDMIQEGVACAKFRSVDCLDYIINSHDIHPDHDKLNWVQEWRTPWNYNNVQQFVRLVNYISIFLPDVTIYMGPLMAITQNGLPFYWQAMHQQCFDMIKSICDQTPVIQPIDPQHNEPIWLICNVSKPGFRAMYGQGTTWRTC
ncbi:Retrotransposable element Tf2 155 kDa protein type 1 [Termitomyces sp. J132]|nr:Retrotransposable element Tf2 155 kDa protein type 1 [Termitomyces sp. J132]